MSASWFVAFPVVAPALDRIEAPAGTVLLAAEDRHVTIAFLGDVGEAAARAAWAVALALDAEPVDATLGAVVPMGDPRRASALAALVAAGHGPLARFMTAHGLPILEAAGRPPETRAPKPHVTLARIARRTTAAERRRAISWAEALDLGRPSVRLDRLALYTAAADRTVRRYRIVEERALVTEGRSCSPTSPTSTS